MDSSFLAGLVLVVVGLVGAFFGYRLFRILLPIYGAVAGFLLIWGWLGESYVLLALLVGIAVGILLAVLAYAIWSALIYLAGALFGVAIGSIIATSLNLWTWLGVVLAVVLAVAFGALFFVIRNEMVIIMTGLAGAATVARGVAEWLGLNSSRTDAAASTLSTGVTLLMAALFIVVAIAGIWFQWGRYRKLNLYGGKAQADQEKPAAPAATRSVQEVPASTVAAAETAAAAPAAVAVAGVAAGAAVVAKEQPVQGAGEVAAPVAEAALVEEERTAGVEAEAVEPVAEAAAEVEAPATEAVVESVEPPLAEAAGELAPDAAAIAEAPVLEIAEPAAAVAAAAAIDAGAAGEPAEEAVPVETEAVASAAVLALGADNKVEESVPVEDAAGGAEDAVADNVVEEVVKDIQENYSFDDIAKFKEKLEFVEGIGPAFAAKLNTAGVNTVLDLLKHGATRKGRQELVEATGITGKLILRWVNHADLYRIKGVGSEYADLLEAAGVDTVVELAHRNPVNLHNAVVETNKVKQLVRKEPVASQVEDWVAQAKQLPRVIQY